MICKLINPDRVPPGGFFYITEDDDAVLVEGFSLNNLLSNLYLYYNSGNKPVPRGLKQMIVCQICERVPKGWCYQKSEGLGDTVKKLTIATGIHRRVKKLAQARGSGTCSGCGSRQRSLNKLVPYGVTRKKMI